MGKWAQYSKRGGTGFIGSVSAPSATDWFAGPGSSGQILGQRVNPLEAGLTGVIARARLVGSSGAFVQGSVGGLFSTIVGLTPAANYDVQLAWVKNLVQASDWSLPKQQIAP